MSEKAKGRVISEEQKKQISQTLKGRPGRKHTEASKAKMIESWKVRKAKAALAKQQEEA